MTRIAMAFLLGADMVAGTIAIIVPGMTARPFGIMMLGSLLAGASVLGMRRRP